MSAEKIRTLLQIIESYDSTFKKKLELLTPRFASAAQKIYDNWTQDDDGYDEEVGTGGICHLIADEFCNILYRSRIQCTTYSAEIGEVHVWVIAWNDRLKEAYNIDIHPSVYETGGAYTWKKRDGVKFDNDIIDIVRTSYHDVKEYIKFD